MNKINQDLVLECGLFGLVIHFGFREKKKKAQSKIRFWMQESHSDFPRNVLFVFTGIHHKDCEKQRKTHFHL